MHKMSKLGKEQLRLKLFEDSLQKKHQRSGKIKINDQDLTKRYDIRQRIEHIQSGENVPSLNLIIEIRLFLHNLLHHSKQVQSDAKNNEQPALH